MWTVVSLYYLFQVHNICNLEVIIFMKRSCNSKNVFFCVFCFTIFYTEKFSWNRCWFYNHTKKGFMNVNDLYLKISHLYRYIEYKSHKGTYIRFCTIFLSTAFLLLTPILNKICCYFIRYLLLGFGNTIHVLSKYQVNLIFF